MSCQLPVESLNRIHGGELTLESRFIEGNTGSNVRVER